MPDVRTIAFHPRPAHRLLLGVLLAVALLAGCGPAAEPGLAPSAGSSGQVVVDITIADGTVTPSGEKVEVAVGQEVVLKVASDADDEIHAHTDTAAGYELEVTAGTPATGSFTVSSPGSFEVESHHLEKTIVILNVR